MYIKDIFSRLCSNDEETTSMTVSIDAGWQKRGSGRSYNSLSGKYYILYMSIYIPLQIYIYLQGMILLIALNWKTICTKSIFTSK